MSNNINPCKPGFGASCSFCCGSHNFKMDKDEIENILNERKFTPEKRTGKNQEDSCYAKVVDDSLQCPHMGMVDSGIIGCLAYNDNDLTGEFNDFFSSVCKDFYCAACKELTDKDVLYAAELMGDWFFYSLLIYNIEILLNLRAEYHSPDDVPEEILSDIKAELEQKLLDEDMI